MRGLRPGESIIKDSGMMPITWLKSRFNTVSGKLVLTTQRLVFGPAMFRDVSRASSPGRNRAVIPLSSITSVEKGFMASISIYSESKYTFNGMRDAQGWVQAINQARMHTGARPSYGGPQPGAYPPSQGPPAGGFYPNQPPSPPPMQGGRFCPNCGASVQPGGRFCASCGARVQ